LWLRITEPDGTKQVARRAFEHIDLVREEVLRAAGLEVNEVPRRPGSRGRRPIWHRRGEQPGTALTSSDAINSPN
jgi:hypothetical protein